MIPLSRLGQTVKQRADEIRLIIAEATAELERIQKECTHPKEGLDETARSNTGNYDPSADCYWVDFHCTLCDKRWSEDR